MVAIDRDEERRRYQKGGNLGVFFFFAICFALRTVLRRIILRN